MSAGVHVPLVSGRKRHAGDFTDGESIHVGAEGNGFVSAGIKPSADSVTVGRKDLAGQFLKHAAHISGGLGKIKVKFRDLVEIAAVFKNALEHESNVLLNNSTGEVSSRVMEIAAVMPGSTSHSVDVDSS